MSVRIKPFDQISVADIEGLIAENVREDQTLDFKAEFPFGDSARIDFVEDVSAMANASGGTIIYGAVEGDGNDRGLITEIRGLDFPAEERQNAVTGLLRDGLDESIPGIMHRAISFNDGHLYVVRIPASRLAPHMIKLSSKRPRFFIRVSTANTPMSVGQIREVVLRSANAEERVRQLIDNRTEYWRKKIPQLVHQGAGGATSHVPAAQLVLHIIPLFPPHGGVDLAAKESRERFEQVPAFGARELSSRHQMSLSGYSNQEFGSYTHPKSEVTLLRAGGVEFHGVGVVSPTHNLGPTFETGWFEDAVLEALAEANGLVDSGLLAMPAVISLRLLQVGNASLYSDFLSRRGEHFVIRRPEENDILVEPRPVTSLEQELQPAAREIFNVLWQAWGYPYCLHYRDDGTRSAFQ